MNFPGLYEKYKELPMQELCEIMADYESSKSKANIARLVYEEQKMAKKHKYELQQIQKQHDLNMDLVTRQVRWIKFSAVLNAIAIIIGIVLGWYLSELKALKQPKLNSRPAIHSQNESLTSVPHSIGKALSIPSQPSIKNK